VCNVAQTGGNPDVTLELQHSARRRLTVTFAAGRVQEATLRGPARPAAYEGAGALVVPSLFRRTAVVVGDLLGVAAIAVSIPFVILAIGIPIALCVRLLLWLGGLL
jgi:hypothetical protein